MKGKKTEYEIITFTCPNCGKKVRMVKHKKLSIEGLLCQKCGQGHEKLENE